MKKGQKTFQPTLHQHSPTPRPKGLMPPKLLHAKQTFPPKKCQDTSTRPGTRKPPAGIPLPAHLHTCPWAHTGVGLAGSLCHQRAAFLHTLPAGTGTRPLSIPVLTFRHLELGCSIELVEAPVSRALARGAAGWAGGKAQSVGHRAEEGTRESGGGREKQRAGRRDGGG